MDSTVVIAQGFTTGEWLLAAACLLVMLVGLIGTLLPVIPGAKLIWVALLVFAWGTGFRAISGEFLIYSGIVVVVITILQYALTVYGARRWGASKWGTLGAFFGMVVGIFFGAFIGAIIGPLIGAVVFELAVGKDFGPALKAGFGTFVGFLVGTIMHVIVSVALVGVFIYRFIAAL